MKQIMNYGYKHFTLENFPFDIKTRQSSNFPIDKHSHESLQICYVAKGSCKHIIYDYECILTKGDIFVVPLNTVHQLERVGAEEIVLIQVDFMPFMINENMTDNATWEYLFDFAYMQPFIFSVNQQMTKFNISSSNQKTIELLFSSMKNEFENQKEGFNISIKADLLKLLVILSREFKEPHNEKILNQSILYHKNILNDIIKYLEDNYAQDIKLEDIASIAHMSPSYISHVFSMVKGTTFIDYLNSLRIRKATEMLRFSARPITEISMEAGFKNISHFNKIFKKYMGITPSNYKKNQ